MSLPSLFTIALAGSNQTFSCDASDILLRAGLRAGLGMSYECNAGACGSCKINLIEGQLEDLYPLATGIKPRDRERGNWLACQSVPRGHCTIKARVLEVYQPRHRPQKWLARFTHVREITHDIHEFTFQTPAPAEFLAGQFAMLQLPGLQSPRAYSMSNIANQQGLWQFMVRKKPSGQMSNALFNLAPDATLGIDGPYGNAYVREDNARDIVCIAGGSGLAPMVSILEATRGSQQLRQREKWLFYGGRASRDVPDIQQLFSAPELQQQITWCPVLSDPPPNDVEKWSGAIGFVHRLVPQQLPQPLVNYEYYFAGPPPMIEATARLLAAEHRVPQAQMHFDRFF